MSDTATHTGLPERKFNCDRGVRGRVHVPGSTRLIVATDGSWKGGTGGYGYVTRNGHWALAARRADRVPQLNPILMRGTGVVVAELRAVAMVINHFPGRAVRFLIDSLDAISHLRSWQAGQVDRMPSGYSLRPRFHGDNPKPALVRLAESVEGRTELRFVHVAGHNGHPMNEAADQLAKIARCAAHGELGDEHAVAERATRVVARFVGETTSRREMA